MLTLLLLEFISVLIFILGCSCVVRFDGRVCFNFASYVFVFSGLFNFSGVCILLEVDINVKIDCWVRVPFGDLLVNPC